MNRVRVLFLFVGKKNDFSYYKGKSPRLHNHHTITMGVCHSTTTGEDFNRLRNVFLLARDTSDKRSFNVVIPAKYELMCDDVITHFQMRGWIIRHLFFSVTLPPKKELSFRETIDVRTFPEYVKRPDDTE